jgi:hypothetical protein
MRLVAPCRRGGAAARVRVQVDDVERRALRVHQDREAPGLVFAGAAAAVAAGEALFSPAA